MARPPPRSSRNVRVGLRNPPKPRIVARVKFDHHRLSDTGPDVTAPTIFTPLTATVAEGEVFSITLTANESVTWSKVGGADEALFTLVGAVLSLAPKDYENPTDADVNNNYVITIRATDAALNTSDMTLTVTVTDVAAPTITSSNTKTVAENATLSHALTANQSVTWSIIGGADQTKFELSGSTLRWASNGTKDFETPDDADTNNAYIVQVRATNAATGDFTSQTITVTVTDVVAPTITSSSAVSVVENSALAHTLTANESVTWSKVGGADTALFTLVGATLGLAAKDYETPIDADTNNSYVVIVRATSVATGETTDQTFTATVTSVGSGVEDDDYAAWLAAA